MLWLKITTLRAAPVVLKPLSFPQLFAADLHFLSPLACVSWWWQHSFFSDSKTAKFFPYFTFKMQFGFYCIYSQLVGLHLFHTFQLNFKKKRWVLQVMGKKTLVQSWWKLDGLYCSIFSPVSNCCTI
jgi:hypothetical protein